MDNVAELAFSEYRDHFRNWDYYIAEWSRMSQLSKTGSVLIAESEGTLVGGVCYIPPGRPRPTWINEEWGVIRSLVVSPAHRGKGIGKALTERCLVMAKEDRCHKIGVQTSPIMQAAVSIYERMGFMEAKTLGTKDGVTWKLYCIDIHNKRVTPFPKKPSRKNHTEGWPTTE